MHIKPNFKKERNIRHREFAFHPPTATLKMRAIDAKLEKAK